MPQETVNITRPHLLDRTMMALSKQKAPPALPPRTRQSDSSKAYDTLTVVCLNHTKEYMKFYCNEHETLACSVCLSLDHRNCTDVSYIPDVAETVKESEEFKQVFDSLKKLQASLTFENRRAVQNEKRNKEIQSKALADILEFREAINQRLDDICAQVKQELMELHDSEVKHSTDWFKGYNGLRPEIDKKVKSLEDNLFRGNNNQLFIDLKLLKLEISDLQARVEQCSRKNTITSYSFVGNQEVIDKLTLGKNVLGMFQVISGRDVTVTVKPLHDINVKTDRDVQDCNINGAISLNNGDLVISDHHNKSVKVIAPSQNKVSSQLILDSEPFDLAAVDDETLAVALANEDKIQIVKLSDTGLSKSNSLKLPFTAVGIECVDDTLIVACQDPGCVRLMNLEGKVLRTINKDYFDRPLFPKPRSVAVSADKSVVYVTDWEKDDVTAISFEGELLAVLKYHKLKRALGMTCDNDGVLYVCSGDTHSVHQLTPSGAYMQMLLGETEGLQFPWAIALDRINNKLYIGSVSKNVHYRNKIKVFQLKYENAHVKRK